MGKQPVVHEIELPSGVRFTGPTLQAAMEKYRQHSCVSIAEGLCPRHATPLKPFPAKPGFVSGNCHACATYYAYEPETGDMHANFYIGGLPPWAA